MTSSDRLHFDSVVQDVGCVALPRPTGLRLLMMPMLLEDVFGSLPVALHAHHWVPVVAALVQLAPCHRGVGYLTLDERLVRNGQHHRRPGLHVDGWPDEGHAGPGGAWGGGGGWGGGQGMVVVASHLGSVAYRQTFSGQPQRFGDCEHLRPQITVGPLPLQAGHVYHLGSLAVHETIPAGGDQFRQFVRLSMPSRAAWPRNCTPNPLGIQPTGPIIDARPAEFTGYEPNL